MNTVIPQEEETSGTTRSGGMLYGVSFAGLVGAFEKVTVPTTYKYIMVFVFATVACLTLAWVLHLRKRLAQHKLYASHQNERYRQFLNDCPDALLVVEQDGSIVSANPKAAQLLQIDEQDLLAHTCLSFIDKVSLSAFRQKFQQCLAGKSLDCEVGIQLDDGSLTPVEVNGSLVRLSGKELVQLYIRDKSVQKEIEEEVHSLYTQLEEATAELEKKDVMLAKQAKLAREELIAKINHRIRTPLDGIMGMGQLLSESTLGIDQYGYVNTILNSSSKLLKVVEALETDPENSLEETKDGFADLHVISDELFRSYDLLAIRKGIQFRSNCHDNVPSKVVADGAKLSQVFSALLDEAFRYTMEGFVMLNIECRRQNRQEAELFFQIIDTGRGIENERQPSTLELSADETGNGITARLSATDCKRVIKQMCGTINRTNSAGKGSTVSISLTVPLSRPGSDTHMDEQPSAFVAPPVSSLENVRILVVDDNKVSQKIAAAILHKAGANVSFAGHGKEALKKVRQQELDLILMDCQMPVMDGFEATAGIRSMPEPINTIPIVALTAHSLKHELQACRDAGMDDCLAKPIRRQILINTVARNMNKGAMETAVLKAS